MQIRADCSDVAERSVASKATSVLLWPANKKKAIATAMARLLCLLNGLIILLIDLRGQHTPAWHLPSFCLLVHSMH